MPTATSTLIKTAYSSQIPLKAIIPELRSPSSGSESSSPTSSATTTATLRTLYNRAARAFLQRDIPLTHSLLDSAFALIQTPASFPDSLADHRRKWDILRITFETTVYSSPPEAQETIPDSLRANSIQSPHALLTTLYGRSLALFTPVNLQKSPANASFIPSQVLVTLIYSSLKIDCADVGRMMIEDWIARRDPTAHRFSSAGSPGETEGDGYEKILELYCLHVLPKLEQWDYAKEFLEYEGELPVETRERFKISLGSLHSQNMSSRSPLKSLTPSPSPSPSSSRSYSPAPSSSSSSSLSTTSTHTVVPSTPRAKRPAHSLSSLTPASTTSSSTGSNTTETPRPRQTNPSRLGPKIRADNSSVASRSASEASAPHSSLPRSHPQAAAINSGRLSTYALIKASLTPYLTTPKTTTFLLLFVVLPLVSLILRVRRRRRMALGGGASTRGSSNVALVRRRLQGGDGGTSIWKEITRIVGDTVKMGGSGLV